MTATTEGDLVMFLYSAGVMKELDIIDGVPGSYEPNAINNHGEIVGGYSSFPGVGQGAWLHKGGVTYDLNDLIPQDSGWRLISAWDINDAGQIVGVGDFHGESRGFVLTRIPEPDVMMTFIATVGAALVIRRRLPRRDGRV